MAASGGHWKGGNFVPAATSQRAEYERIAAAQWGLLDMGEQNSWIVRGGREGFIRNTAAGMERLAKFVQTIPAGKYKTG